MAFNWEKSSRIPRWLLGFLGLATKIKSILMTLLVYSLGMPLFLAVCLSYRQDCCCPPVGICIALLVLC